MIVKIHFLEKQKLCLYCNGRNGFLMMMTMTTHTHTHTHTHPSLFTLHIINESSHFSTSDSCTCYWSPLTTAGWHTAVCYSCVWQRSVTWFSMPIEVLLIMLELFVKFEVPAFGPCRGRVRLLAALTLLVTLPETWSTCNVLQCLAIHNAIQPLCLKYTC